MKRLLMSLGAMGVAACGADDTGPGEVDTASDVVEVDVETLDDTQAAEVDATAIEVDASDGDTSPEVDAPDGDTTAPAKWIMGYYAGYARDDYPAADVAWGTLTHLAIAFYLPNADGTLEEHLFIDDTAGPQLARDLVAGAHANGVEVIASIGGAGMRDAFAAAASEGTRAAFVANLVALVDRYDFDGLDLDWEPILEADRPAVTALVRALRVALPDATLTMPVGFENANFPSDLSFYATLSGDLDQINAMTYSMAGAYDGWLSWHSSALYHGDARTPTSVDDTLQAYLDDGVPAAKLGVGAGFYGLCYSAPVTAPGQALAGSEVIAQDYDLTYTHLATTYDLSQASWDAFAHVPYLSLDGADGCTYVSYEDARSLGDKADYVVEHGLGGVIIWTINQGYLEGAPEPDPLLRALRAALP